MSMDGRYFVIPGTVSHRRGFQPAPNTFGLSYTITLPLHPRSHHFFDEQLRVDLFAIQVEIHLAFLRRPGLQEASSIDFQQIARQTTTRRRVFFSSLTVRSETFPVPFVCRVHCVIVDNHMSAILRKPHIDFGPFAKSPRRTSR